MAARTLEDFRRENDPEYVIQSPLIEYKRELKPASVYLITAAQNATPVHAEFFATLLRIAKHRKAELLVIPVRYKNPTSSWSGSQQNAEHWDAACRPYLWNVRHTLNKNIDVLADLRVQPTASSPLTGAEALSKASSGIIGHTKVQLKGVPVPAGKTPKVLATTGACTLANYTDSRAGHVGAFHHSLAAVIVELDGGRFYMRHLHWDEGSQSVTDLAVRYTPKGATKAPPPLALVMGDTHVGFVDPGVEKATFGPDGLVNKLKPRHLVWHDALDSYSCNPHHVGNPFNAVAKMRGATGNVRREVKNAIDYIIERTTESTTSVVVGSNHDDMLRRYIIRGDWKSDPVNADFYLETALAMVRGTKFTGKGAEYPDPFVYWFRKATDGTKGFKALDQDESFVLGGVELGLHGDLGPNGSRGSIKNLRRLGAKVIIGHSHTPGIDEGAYQTGTSTNLRLEYNTGPSSWMNAHVVLHADGKRQLVFIIDGKFTTQNSASGNLAK